MTTSRAAHWRLGWRRNTGWVISISQICGFLKAHIVYEDYSIEDFEREREALKSLGF
jgi:hypothetical protein